MASSSTKLTLKLLIDTKREKVLFAEASKAVIDFLFNLLCLPVSTVIRLLSKEGMVGCIGNLYQSVENLNDTYMQSDQANKDILLKPRTLIPSPEISGLLPPTDGFTDDNLASAKFYKCSNSSYHNYVTCDNKTPCPSCSCTMNTEMQYLSSEVAGNKFLTKSGFVKEVVTYMVMDDLVVEPMSTISSITLLNKFNVKEIGALEEKVVEFGMTQGVNLLKASLQSKNVLTSVFLKNNGAS